MIKLTATQRKTLNTLIALGGEANSYRGTEGLNLNSAASLVRLGLVATDPRACYCTNGQHSFEHGAVSTGRSDDHTAYYRLTVTPAGYEA